MNVLAKYQERFRYINVDSIKIPTASVRNCKHIQHRNLMVVGDDDQSIYSWRGQTSKKHLGVRERL